MPSDETQKAKSTPVVGKPIEYQLNDNFIERYANNVFIVPFPAQRVYSLPGIRSAYYPLAVSRLGII